LGLVGKILRSILGVALDYLNFQAHNRIGALTGFVVKRLRRVGIAETSLARLVPVRQRQPAFRSLPAPSAMPTTWEVAR
jgi:hypothetical protein